LNHIRAAMGIPDSAFSGNALGAGCAEAASGEIVAPPSSEINSRRLE
jgi:phosphotransferase system IIA component